MTEDNNRWAWFVRGFEAETGLCPDGDGDGDEKLSAVARRSISSSSSSIVPWREPGGSSLPAKVQRLQVQLKLVREDYMKLRQEATDIKEYSNAKLDRVTRYLGALADRARKLDQVALESEARIATLISEKKRLFNDFSTAKGSTKAFCRVRPLFEDEGLSIVEFPDDYTIQISTGDDSVTNPKKDYKFDRVYGPHVGQGELFNDIRPFVQSAMEGFNVSIFAYGQSHSGKTYTLEGSSQERGLYQRCFEELFDLSNSDSSSCQYKFYVTVFELYNEKVCDLLKEPGTDTARVHFGPLDFSVELVQAKVSNPSEFSGVLKAASISRGVDMAKAIVSHLIVTIHIHRTNWITRENIYSKVSLVDLPGSECFLVEDASGDHDTDHLHVSNTLSVLGDVLFSLTSNKDTIPYENSMLTKLLADSMGVNSRSLLIVNICPNVSNISSTLSALNFSRRARNSELSLGILDTTKKWRDMENASRKEAYDKEKEIYDLRQEVTGLKLALKEANDQCMLLFNEVQNVHKVSSTLQADIKSEKIMLVDKQKMEEQNYQLKNQVAHLLHVEQEQESQIRDRDLTIKALEEKMKSIESQLIEVRQSTVARSTGGLESGTTEFFSTTKGSLHSVDPVMITKRLEEELSKRDALIEKLHEENVKLFERLTEKAGSGGSSQVLRTNDHLYHEMSRNGSMMGSSQDALPVPVTQDRSDRTYSLVLSGPDKVMSTPAGAYLTAALINFDPDQFETFATLADGANKLLMLVLAAVIKAGAAREHEILAEIRDAVLSFLRKMELKRVMDTMLVSRVRILYIRSLLGKSPELQSIKVSPVERFLEKASIERSVVSGRGSSPGSSPGYHDLSDRAAVVDEHIHGFKVNLKQEKMSKLSSIVLKLRGIDQETWRQHVTGGKLREIVEEAKAFAIGNKALAALFVHTAAGVLQRQIRSWLTENFEFLAMGVETGKLELLATAIMDGWMAGLGAVQPPNTDALGQLLSEYTKRFYTSQLHHLKVIAGTLAVEVAENLPHVNKLHSALESVNHKRKKIMQQMRNDVALLTKEEGGSPLNNPSTFDEEARLTSLISLEGILKQVKDIVERASVASLTKSRKKELLSSLDELAETITMPSLIDIDYTCAQKQITDARKVMESIPVESSHSICESQIPHGSSDYSAGEVHQWNVLQFNTFSKSSPLIIKCGANTNCQLVIKAEARVQEPKGDEIVRVLPQPQELADMSFIEIKQVFDHLPESVSFLVTARTADSTRARYSRLYRTLVSKVPSLKDQVAEMERSGMFNDPRS